MHPAWCVVAALVAYVAYATLVVHKVRMASLRAVRGAQAALQENQLDLAWTLLADMEHMYDA